MEVHIEDICGCCIGHACIHTYTHTYIHTYIQTYIHTYISTYVYRGLQLSMDHVIKPNEVHSVFTTGLEFDSALAISKGLSKRYWKIYGGLPKLGVLFWGSQ